MVSRYTDIIPRIEGVIRYDVSLLLKSCSGQGSWCPAYQGEITTERPTLIQIIKCRQAQIMGLIES